MHSLRSATEYPEDEQEQENVSIHALLAECDHRRNICGPLLLGFNPRTPCGVRLDKTIDQLEGSGFQSTHSLRSATKHITLTNNDMDVSIHALLAECDRTINYSLMGTKGFNPRTPCGVRLYIGLHKVCKIVVSIHALLAECDSA